ncbi:MAG: NifB/NifX family molybdenum-iron cluster-binding protein [Thermoplasmata archaeon]
MLVCATVNDDIIDDLGDSKEVVLIEVSGNEYRIVERYENPAMNATLTKGIHTINSAIEKHASAIITAGIGKPGFRYAKGRIKIYASGARRMDTVMNEFINGILQETHEATHEGGPHDMH